jgi:hypothetical protein
VMLTAEENSGPIGIGCDYRTICKILYCLCYPQSLLVPFLYILQPLHEFHFFYPPFPTIITTSSILLVYYYFASPSTNFHTVAAASEFLTTYKLDLVQCCPEQTPPFQCRYMTGDIERFRTINWAIDDGT